MTNLKKLGWTGLAAALALGPALWCHGIHDAAKRGDREIACSLADTPPAAISLPDQSPAGEGFTIEVRRISDRAIVLNLTGVPQSTNIIALRSKKGIAVIDSEAVPAFGAAIRERIVQEFGGERIAFLINTHDHPDHTYGNQAFSDAEIIGHETVPAQMKQGEESRKRQVERFKKMVPQMEGRLQKMDPDSVEAKKLAASLFYYRHLSRGWDAEFVLTPPTKTFAGKMALDLGDLTLELSFYGLSHSDSDILAFCPEEKLLATGDIFYAGAEPYIDSKRVPHLSRWIGNLESLLGRKEDLVRIVPGHGEFLQIEELEKTLTVLKRRLPEFEGRQSAMDAVTEIYKEAGVDAALAKMKELKSRPAQYFFLHGEFDTFAFGLMRQGKLDEALSMFTLLAGFFPESYLAFDSLGEACLQKGDKESAVQYFKKSLELNPENDNAKTKLAQLEIKK